MKKLLNLHHSNFEKVLSPATKYCCVGYRTNFSWGACNRSLHVCIDNEVVVSWSTRALTLLSAIRSEPTVRSVQQTTVPNELWTEFVDTITALCWWTHVPTVLTFLKLVERDCKYFLKFTSSLIRTGKVRFLWSHK